MLAQQIRKLIKKYGLEALTAEPTDGYYDHTTFSVQSLSEFIKLIEAFAELNKKSPFETFFYRGMADMQWKLVPSLMRKLSEVKNNYALEHDLSVEFCSEMPGLFKNADSNFEKIAKMQHFGIPTRLLDFTLNPLVALYFACADHPRTYGRVVFTANRLHYFDDPSAECSASLYLYDNCNNIPVEEWLRPHNISVCDYLFGTFTETRMSSPLFVKPPYLDDRMHAQRSVFLMFHNNIRDILSDCRYYKYKEVDTHVFECEDPAFIYREQILYPRAGFINAPFFILDKRSFGRLTDSYRKHDFDNFNKNINAALANRFYLQDTISPLEMTDIRNEFSSIIIPPKSKKTILTQLEQIGIDEAYMYPEAEHIAGRIKGRAR